mgnify:CR=1 FL=1
MENKEKMDKTDKYMLVLMGLLYLYMYGKNVIGAAMHVTGWDWIFFIIFAVIALVFCLLAWLASFTIAMETIKYFGLPKNYVWATILAVVIAPLTIIFLSLVFSGVIPSIFDPRFL